MFCRQEFRFPSSSKPIQPVSANVKVSKVLDREPVELTVRTERGEKIALLARLICNHHSGAFLRPKSLRLPPFQRWLYPRD